MTGNTEKSPLSPLRLIAIALVSAMAFAAIMVPLHKVLHAPPSLALQAQAAEQQARTAESAHTTQEAIARQEAQQLKFQDGDLLKPAAHTHTDHSPFGHQAGKDCDNWNAVFGAESLATQPLGVIGPDASLAHKITPPRDVQYARLSATQNLARGPPRC
jgi:hypothetical protein